MKSKVLKKEYLESNYPQIAPINKITKLRHNDLNSKNFLVHSKNGKFVFHINADKKSVKRIEDVCRVLKFCSDNAINVSEPVARKDGKFVDKEHNCYLTKYYEGRLHNGSVKELRELSKNIANLHIVLSRYPSRFSHTDDDRPYKILTDSDLEKIYRNMESKSRISSIDRKFLRNIPFIKECINKDLAYSKTIKRLKSSKQLIHSDLHPKNVIFSKGRISAILDFNSLRTGMIEEDLAFASYRFASYKKRDVREIKNKIADFIDTYKGHNSIKNRTKLICYFFRHITLQRLCYIIRMRYFKNSDLWTADFDKQLSLLKLQDRIESL